MDLPSGLKCNLPGARGFLGRVHKLTQAMHSDISPAFLSVLKIATASTQGCCVQSTCSRKEYTSPAPPQKNGIPTNVPQKYPRCFLTAGMI